VAAWLVVPDTVGSQWTSHSLEASPFAPAVAVCSAAGMKGSTRCWSSVSAPWLAAVRVSSVVSAGEVTELWVWPET